MSFLSSFVSGMGSFGNAITGLGRSAGGLIAGNAVSFVESASNYAIVVGSGVTGAGKLIGDGMVVFGSDLTRFSISTAGTVVGWSKTCAYDVENYARAAPGMAASFSMLAYDNARRGLAAAWKFITDLFAKTLPELDEPSPLAETIARLVLGPSSFAHEQMAQAAGMTIGFTLSPQGSLFFGLSYTVGLYVDPEGSWGFMKLAGLDEIKNLSTATLSSNINLSISFGMTWVFGGRSRFSGARYFDLGVDVSVKLLTVGAGVLIESPDMSFLGFRLTTSLGLDLQATGGKNVKASFSVNGSSVDVANVVGAAGSSGSSYDTAVRAVQNPGIGPHRSAALLATTMTPFAPRFYGHLRLLDQPDKFLCRSGDLLKLAAIPPAGDAFHFVAGLADPKGVSIEVLDAKGIPLYVRANGYAVSLQRYEDNDTFRNEATFDLERGLGGENHVSFRLRTLHNGYLFYGQQIYDMLWPDARLSALGFTNNDGYRKLATFILEPLPLPANQTAVLRSGETLREGEWRRSPDGRYFAQIERDGSIRIFSGSGPSDLRPWALNDTVGLSFASLVRSDPSLPLAFTVPPHGKPFLWQGSDPNAPGAVLGDVNYYGDPGPSFLAVTDGGAVGMFQGVPERPGELLTTMRHGAIPWAKSRHNAALKSSTGQYVGINPANETTLRTNIPTFGSKESFEFVTLCDDSVALRTSSGTYLAVARDTPSLRLSSVILPDCVFWMEARADGMIAFRSVGTSRYLRASEAAELTTTTDGNDPRTPFRLILVERILSAEVGRSFGLTAKHSGKRLTVSGASKAAETRVVQQPATGSRNQAFTLARVDGGQYLFAAQHSGFVIGLPMPSINGPVIFVDPFAPLRQPGRALAQLSPTGDVLQQFQLHPNEDGSYCIVQAWNGLYLEIAAESQADGAVLIQNVPTGRDNQRFYIRPEPPLPTRVLVAEPRLGKPTIAHYQERLLQSTWLDGFLDLGGLRLVGDFANRKRAQLLCVQRSGAEARLLLADLGAGSSPGQVVFPQLLSAQPWTNGFFGETDWARAGDFLGKGYSQLLLINRGGDGDRVRIVDLTPLSQGAAPAITVMSRWGEPLFDDWHDDNDLWLTGDFLGRGNDQLLCISRTPFPGRGKLMLVSFASGAPSIEYLERWGDDSWLDGWLDDAVRHYVGDFMGQGRAQWMAIDTRILALRVFELFNGQRHMPYVAQLVPQLAGFMDGLDTAVVGDFLGRGRAQLLCANRQPGTGDKLRILELGPGAPITVPWSEAWIDPVYARASQSGQERPLTEGLIEPGDSLYAADFIGAGGKRAQLLVTNPNTQSESPPAPSFGLGHAPPLTSVPDYSGNRWRRIGEAWLVVAMAWHQGSLYIVSSNRLYRRQSFAEGSGNAWEDAGEAYGVVAMASHQGSLYIVSNNRVYKRGRLGPGTGNDWHDCGEAYGVTAMASHQGTLYIVTGNWLMRRGALGPGTGNDWYQVGEAYGVLGMSSHQDQLYIISNSRLYRRGSLNPGSGNDWAVCGNAERSAHLASSGQTLYTVVDNNSLVGLTGTGPVPSAAGNRWLRLGEAWLVVAMAWHQGELYIVSSNRLYRRLSFYENSGNAWEDAGEAYGVVAMASHQGSLYIVSNNRVYKRGRLGPGTGNDWHDCGEAYGVTAMASHQGTLYIVTGNWLMRRGALGPGTGNDWYQVGEAYGQSLISHQGELYLLSRQNGRLYRRGVIGVGSGNDWYDAGPASGLLHVASSEKTVYSVSENSLFMLN